ncbi:DUF397 domain-containing protein [Amycolatopsis cihanbeyliensis]|uniref:Uncharacterized protein DUF397 n=1 Tax=Amycolatopsis cihanbeyliensis TaxID=1128664 RepID=A0A542DLV7_AMYCI|nr:DUF397 domain-containing protein [Amycolatopsis cihanbeyliensis]TQJ03965.1 uncharacterized protein DUF397 [Amycolatopsis cihanbeyliensis]
MISAEHHFTGWRRSSYSTAGQNCVEVATSGRVVGVRDSKNPAGAPLALSPTAWSAFLATLSSTR